MNQVVLIGRLTRDPELKYTTNNQTAVTRFTLAVDKPYQKDKEKEASFIRCIAFGKAAENLDRYKRKGDQIALQGHIDTGSYTDKDGKTVYTTDVIADKIEFVGNKGDRPQEDERERAEAHVDSQEVFGGFSEAEDDIPF